MKLINYPPNESMEIEFRLDIDDRLLKMREDFCLYLDIIVSLNKKVHEYKGIKIDKTSIKRFIEHINRYLNKEIDEIDYSPFEEHFWLFEKKFKLSEEDLINEINRMEKLGCDKETVKKLRSEPYTITLVLLVNKEYADKHGCSPRTGESYIINITKENLKDFIKKLKFKYETLISNI
jgi:hypothetical protein